MSIIEIPLSYKEKVVDFPIDGETYFLTDAEGKYRLSRTRYIKGKYNSANQTIDGKPIVEHYISNIINPKTGDLYNGGGRMRSRKSRRKRRRTLKKCKKTKSRK